MKISDFSIKHPVVIGICLVAVFVFGFYSLSGMKKDLIAQSALPQIVVLAVYPGASASDVERDVTDVLERELGNISGIDTLESTSMNSVSVLVITFKWSENTDQKANDVRDVINNSMSELPENLEGIPELLKSSSSMMSIMTLLVESDYERAVLDDFLENRMVPHLSRISGVSTVRVRGPREKIVRISLYPEQLEAKGVSALEVFQLLNHNNVSFPGGTVKLYGKSLSFRTAGEFSSLEEMGNMTVGYKDETFIRLKDVAEIRHEYRKADIFVDSGLKAAYAVDIFKQEGGNTMEIIKEGKQILHELQRESGEMVRFSSVVDNSQDINLAINSVVKSALLGGFLAILVLLVFLHDLRTTLIIACSIPLTLLFTFMGMALKGQSINVMTLAGMTVAIGMIVDASVVILENIYRHFAAGMSARKAALKGSREVGGAIIASALTSLSVFVPLATMEGFTGVMLGDLSLVIVFALGSSTLVALVVVPFMTSLLLKKKNRAPGWFPRCFDRFFTVFSGGYRKSLKAALEDRLFVVFLAVAVLALSVMSFDFLGFEFFAAPDMNELEIKVKTPAVFSVDQTHEKMLEISRLIEQEVPEKETVLLYTGLQDSLGLTSKSSEGYIRLRLKRSIFRQRSVFDIIAALQKAIDSRICDVDGTVSNGGLAKMMAYVSGGDGLKIEVYGDDWPQVVKSARMVSDLLAQDPVVSKAALSVSFDQQEIVSDLDMDYTNNMGITPYEAGLNARILFNGMEAGTYRLPEDSWPIWLDSTLSNAPVSEDLLNRIFIKTRQEKMVSYAGFASMDIRPVADKIPHKNRMKSIVVTGYMTEGDLRGIQSRVLPHLESMNFPPGVRWKLAGSADLMVDVFLDLLIVLGIAVFLVYMVMVIQFERFTQPFIIMGSVPFTLIGVVLGLLLFGSSLSIISFLGIIALAGMVVNNAIVLVDYTNLLRREYGRDLTTAVLEAGESRLKPILMTTLTTILGVIPMAMALGEGSEIYAPLGQVIGGGLLTSTLITLFIIPVLYFQLEKRHEMRKNKEA